MTSPLPRRTRTAFLALGLLASASCGTRLPDRAFTPFQVGSTALAQSEDGASAAGEGAPPAPSGDNTALPGLGGIAQPGISTSPGADSAGPRGGSAEPDGRQRQTPASGHPAANFASDRGVTATSINVCNIVTKGGPFGPYQFTPSYYGAAAYFAALNVQGGINGRRVNFVSHPDEGNNPSNLDQTKTCVNDDKAFAFVANDVYQYAGADLVNKMGIPDIGGQPISTAYYLYPHLFPLDGFHQPRDGKTLGLHGYGYRTNEIAEYFKATQHIKHVGVIFYDQASSQYGANVSINDFRAAGVTVSTYQVNLGLPNFASAVAQMKADGVDMVADALDLNGSQKFCQAAEGNGAFMAQMKIKLTTTGGWNQSIGNDFSSTPKCAAKTWADAYSVNFDDTTNPQVAAFQEAVRRYFPDSLPHNHQFALEGWIAAMWFTDAARSCGARLTRTCVERYMNRPTNYAARGLLVTNVGYKILPPSFYSQTHRLCVSIAQWSNPADKWITRAKPSTDCFVAHGYKYKLTDPT